MIKTGAAVVFGGPSAEHDVSVSTGEEIIRNLDPEKYRIYPLYIDRDRGWRFSEEPLKNPGQFRLAEYRNRPAWTLSGGQRQLLRIATFLILDCELILFDEPAAGLDEPSKNLLISALADISSSGTAVLAASSQPVPASCPAGTRRLWINDGKLYEK